jgi:hypothetical protein
MQFFRHYFCIFVSTAAPRTDAVPAAGFGQVADGRVQIVLLHIAVPCLEHNGKLLRQSVCKSACQLRQNNSAATVRGGACSLKKYFSSSAGMALRMAYATQATFKLLHKHKKHKKQNKKQN